MINNEDEDEGRDDHHDSPFCFVSWGCGWLAGWGWLVDGMIERCRFFPIIRPRFENRRLLQEQGKEEETTRKRRKKDEDFSLWFFFFLNFLKRKKK